MKKFIISQDLVESVLNYIASRVSTEMKLMQELQKLQPIEELVQDTKLEEKTPEGG